MCVCVCVFECLCGTLWVLLQAISLRTGNKGEVPASYLVKKSDEEVATANGGRQGGLEERLKGYPWYLGKKSRIDAEQALHRMKDGVFLIRESDVRPGEYAIALKYVPVVYCFSGIRIKSCVVIQVEKDAKTHKNL